MVRNSLSLVWEYGPRSLEVWTIVWTDGSVTCPETWLDMAPGMSVLDLCPRDRRVSDRLFGVHLFASVRPLNACPPEGPEALQACSLFQGTKAWLEPRLEPAELIPALPWTRSAVLVIEQAFFVRLVRLFS